MSGVLVITGASRGIGAARKVAEEIAEAAVFLASSRASYIRGTTIDVTGGR